MARCRRKSWCGATAALAPACWRSRARLQGPPALDAHAVPRRSAGLGEVGVPASGWHPAQRLELHHQSMKAGSGFCVSLRFATPAPAAR